MGKKLVMGASGFLGSHVARELVERGEDVRVLVRASSSTQGFADLDVEVVHGDIFDAESVRRAMDGCDVVFYCVVDARPWLRDPTPLFRTNVEGLRTVLEVAVDQDLHRFVFTSSMGTLALDPDVPTTEDQPHNWGHKGGAYIRSRVDAEDLVLDYARERGLPAVSMCVANTYGFGDHLPTPHGRLLAAAARGKTSWYVPGAGGEVVGIRSAARALVLAAERGRVGERYLVADRYMSTREVHDTAAAAVGAPPARTAVPSWLLYAGAAVSEVVAKVLRRDLQLTRTTVRLMSIWTPMDHAKATRELGWEPTPVTEEIREAALFFTQDRRSMT